MTLPDGWAALPPELLDEVLRKQLQPVDLAVAAVYALTFRTRQLESGRGNYAHFVAADTLRVGGNGAWLLGQWDATEYWGRNYITMQVAGAVERLGQRGWLEVERLGRDYVRVRLGARFEPSRDA